MGVIQNGVKFVLGGMSKSMPQISVSSKNVCYLKLCIVFLFFAINLCLSNVVLAETCYVSVTGGALPHDGSQGREYTLSEAKVFASSNTGRELTFLLKEGNYGDFDASGTGRASGKWVTYEGVNSGNKPNIERFIVSSTQNAYIKIKKINISRPENNPDLARGILDLRGSSYVQLHDSYVKGAWRYTIRVDGCDNVVINNSEIIWGNMGIFERNSSNVTITNNDIHNNYGAAMGLYDGVNILMENNHMHDAWRIAETAGEHMNIVQVQYMTPGGCKNLVFRGNRFGNASGQGVSIESMFLDSGAYGQGLVFENNLIYGSIGSGPFKIRSTRGFVVRNNTIVPESTIGCSIYDQVQDGLVYNNIIEGTFSVGGDAVNVKLDYNIYEFYRTWGGPLPKGPHDRDNTIVQFVDRTNNNYRLTEYSVARDFGDPANATAADILGVQRDSKPDAGCYEYVGSSIPSNPPTLNIIGDRQVKVGETLTFAVNAYDPDGDAIIYSAINLSAGAIFAGQIFTWTPLQSQVGTCQVTFVASDGKFQDTETITVTVSENGSVPPPVAAYYVDKNHPSASDSSPGTENLPWLTITHAANTVQAGDTVCIKGGTYYESVTPVNSGEPQKIITFKSYVGDTVIVEGKFNLENKNYVKLDGLKLVGASRSTGGEAVRVPGSVGLVIENCKMTNWENGVNGWGGSDITIRNCQMIDLGEDGIKLADWQQGLFEDNVIAHLDGSGGHSDGMDLRKVDNIVARRNLVHDVGNSAFQISPASDLFPDLYYGGRNITLENNVFYNGRNFICYILDSENVKIFNNVMWGGYWGGLQLGSFHGLSDPRHIGVVNAQIYNNILESIDFYVGVKDQGGTSADVDLSYYQGDNNLIGYMGWPFNWQAHANDIVGLDPLFANISGTVIYGQKGPVSLNPVPTDFQIKETSPAIDAGTGVHGEPIVDFWGNPRVGAHDLGIHECQFGNPIPPVERVGYWKLDEFSGTIAEDSSGLGNKGILVNGPIWTEGKLNGAISFESANQAVEVGTNGCRADQGTISLWACPTAFPSTTQFLFGHIAGGWNNRIQIYTNDAAGSLGIGLGDTHKRQTNIYDLNINTWYNIVLTWDQTNYVVYVNGIKQANGTYSGLSTLSGYADIGNNGDRVGRNEGFKGLIDEVGIYNRPLSADEVLNIFNSVGHLAFSPIGDKEINEGANLTFEVITDDPSIVVSISDHNLPSNPNITGNIFSWTPSYVDAGTYEVTFVAAHGQVEDFETITITVNNVNRSPVIEPLSAKTVNENNTLTFAVITTDPDGDPVTCLAQNMPGGAAFNGSTFTWTPNYQQAGTYNVTFIASDGSLQNSATVTITVNNVIQPDDIAGLVGFWKFDDGSGAIAKDSSGKGNTGTLINAPSWTVGRLGGAVSFKSSNQAVEIGTTGCSVAQGTISLWAYPTAFPRTTQFMFGHVAVGWKNRIQIYTNNTEGGLGIGFGGSHKLANNIYDLAIGTWYHIVLSWNGTNYVVYVNGVKQASGTYTGLSTLSTYADIGNTGNRTDRNEAFSGIIDEVRIYNRALTADEVSSLFR